jgi:hypothetical protein
VMYEEITSASPVYGETLVDVFQGPDKATLSWVIVVGGALFALSRLTVGMFASHPVGALLSVAARSGVTALVVWIVVEGDLAFVAPWSFRLFWLAVMITVLSSIVRRAPDFSGLVTCSLGWMVTLSWGLPSPAFAGGVLALYVVVRTWQDLVLPPQSHLDGTLALAGVATAALVIGTFWNMRNDHVFLTQRPVADLVYPLGGVSKRLRGIRTDSAHAQYFVWVKRCVDRFPAKWTAVVPEDAVSGPAFGLHSPLQMDWLWPAEYGWDYDGKSRERIIDAARKVGREGDYLFLFQQLLVTDLAAVPRLAPITTARPGDQPRGFPYDPDLSTQILAALDGRRIACGPFVAVYEPRRP